MNLYFTNYISLGIPIRSKEVKFQIWTTHKYGSWYKFNALQQVTPNIRPSQYLDGLKSFGMIEQSTLYYWEEKLLIFEAITFCHEVLRETVSSMGNFAASGG